MCHFILPTIIHSTLSVVMEGREREVCDEWVSKYGTETRKLSCNCCGECHEWRNYIVFYWTRANERALKILCWWYEEEIWARPVTVHLMTVCIFGVWRVFFVHSTATAVFLFNHILWMGAIILLKDIFNPFPATKLSDWLRRFAFY